MCTYISCLFIRSSLSGYLSLGYVINAAMNMGMQISHQGSDFIFFGYICRSGITGSCGSSVTEEHLGSCCLLPPSRGKGLVVKERSLYSEASHFGIEGFHMH